MPAVFTGVIWPKSAIIALVCFNSQIFWCSNFSKMDISQQRCRLQTCKINPIILKTPRYLWNPQTSVEPNLFLHHRDRHFNDLLDRPWLWTAGGENGLVMSTCIIYICEQMDPCSGYRWLVVPKCWDRRTLAKHSEHHAIVFLSAGAWATTGVWMYWHVHVRHAPSA